MIDSLVKILRGLGFGALALVVGAWIQWEGKSLSSRVELQVQGVKQSVAYKQALVWVERTAFEAKEKVVTWLGGSTRSAAKGAPSPIMGKLPSQTNQDSISPQEQGELRELMGSLEPKTKGH